MSKKDSKNKPNKQNKKDKKNTPGPSTSSKDDSPTYTNVNIQKILRLAQITAQGIIDDARRNKAAKIKTAKQEAEVELSKYRLQRQAEFENIEKVQKGKRDRMIRKINRDTDKQIKALTTSINKKKADLIEELIKMVCDIRAEVHPNYQIKKILADTND